MIRRQIQLTREQDAALRALAVERGVSMAELVRESVARYLVQEDVRGDDRVQRALALAGKFRTGLPDLAANHDGYLYPVGEER